MPLKFVDLDAAGVPPPDRSRSGSGGQPRGLRILVYGLNYAPELTGIGKYTGELCTWLAQRGHAVRVITAPPYYPAWRIDAAYAGRRWHRERYEGVDVWRCPLWVPEKPSGLKRVLHLLSFAATSSPLLATQAGWRPDVVLAIEPTLACALPAWMVARATGARAWLHVQDFEVDAAFSLGLLPKRLRPAVMAFERQLMRRFDRVSTISEKMYELLAAKSVPPDRRVLFPNWVDCRAIYPRGAASEFRAQLNIPPESFVALYAGNMGEKQGLEVLIDAAHELRNDRGLTFVLCGEGAARARLQEKAQGLDNIRWLPLQPFARLNDLLNLADVHVLPQRADAADLVMPSKLTGMLASGRPVIATAHPNTELGRVVSATGRVTPPGDVAAFVAAIRDLKNDVLTRHALGREARRYAECQLHKDVVLTQFEEALRLCVHQTAAA